MLRPQLSLIFLSPFHLYLKLYFMLETQPGRLDAAVCFYVSQPEGCVF